MVRGIAIERLTKSFGPVRAIDDLSFTAEPGSITGFLGPNGAGKTTTLRILLGLVRPDAGSATIDGRAYADLPAPAGQVGALLEAAGFHPARSGRDHLRVYCTASGYPRSRADEVLELVGLTAAGRRAVGGYSLGMRQRLALAAAMLGDPAVLILDEPANGLDPGGIAWLRRLLQELAERGRTVLVSSHVLSEMAQLVDRVVIVRDGRLVHQGTLAELGRRHAPAVAVRTPRPAALAAALERMAPGRARIERTGADSLRVTGLDAARVGHRAFVEGVELHGLAAEGGDLEQVFFALTGGEAVAA